MHIPEYHLEDVSTKEFLMESKNNSTNLKEMIEPMDMDRTIGGLDRGEGSEKITEPKTYHVEDPNFLHYKYNQMMEYIGNFTKFMICEKSAIRAKNSVIFTQGFKDFQVKNFAEMAKMNKCNYMSCITTEDSKHICDIYPVMIGSNLDIFLCKEYGIFENYIPDPILTGYFIINGSLAIFPFLLTNRKDLIHVGNKIYDQKIFFYNRENMGYKIYVNELGEFVYRNEKGVEVTIYNRKDCLEMGINYTKIKIENYCIDDEHLDINNMKFAFNLLGKFIIDIDSFHNKLIISPTNILHLTSIISKKRGEEVASYLRQGNLSKFDSLKLEYVKERNSFGSSFEYRMVAPNVIGRKYLDRVVIRLIATNVTNKVITDAEHFICTIEKNISIDSFNKVLNLLPNVEVSDHLSYLNNDLNSILNDLLADGLIEVINYDNLSESDVYILLNGGLMSPYKLNGNFLELFFYIKNMNEMIEVIHMDRWVMINQTNGLPFIKVRNVYMTPLELKIIYPNIRLTNELEIFGYNTRSESKFIAYANKTKRISGMNYHKTRLSSAKTEKYYGYTTETILTYINDAKFDYERENIKGNILFSTHPQISGDGYIVNKKFEINTNFIFRMKLELDVYLDTVVTCNPITKDSFMVEYDNLGNVIAKTVCVMNLKSNSDLLQFKIFHQNKFCESRSISNKESNIYKRFEESESLRDDVEYKIFCIEKFDKKNSNKKRIMYEFGIFQVVPFYDGLKFSDISSQKGLATRQDLSRYKNSIGTEPDVVASLFTVLSRVSIPQIKEIASNRKQLANKKVLYGPYNLDILKNTSLAMLNKGGVNADLYTNKVMMTNGLTYSLYDLSQKAFSRSEYKQFLPNENFNALNNFNVLKTAFEFNDLNGNTFNGLNVNRGIQFEGMGDPKDEEEVVNDIKWVCSRFSKFTIDNLPLDNCVEDLNETCPIFKSFKINPRQLNFGGKRIVSKFKHPNYLKIMEIDKRVDMFSENLKILEFNNDYSNEPFSNYISSKYIDCKKSLYNQFDELLNDNSKDYDVSISTVNPQFPFEGLKMEINHLISQLKMGGSCIFRIYDCFSKKSLILLHLIYHSFKDFAIYKTLWDESEDEKYILCLYKIKDLSIHMCNLEKIPIDEILKDQIFCNYVYSLFNDK